MAVQGDPQHTLLALRTSPLELALLGRLAGGGRMRLEALPRGGPRFLEHIRGLALYRGLGLAHAIRKKCRLAAWR
jgi:hypothetical protein